MIQPALQKSISIDDVCSTEIEAAFQAGIREALIRDARLGFPAVSGENGEVVFWPPERVLAELDNGAEP